MGGYSDQVGLLLLVDVIGEGGYTYGYEGEGKCWWGCGKCERVPEESVGWFERVGKH
jgi:hypothetical protein